MRRFVALHLALLMAATPAPGVIVFDFIAPAASSSYLLEEDWNTGSKPAQATDTGSPDYSSGSSVTFGMGDTSLFTFTGSSTVGVHFEVTPSNASVNQQIFWIRDSSGAMIAEFRQRTSGAVRIATGAQTSTSGTGVLTNGTKAYVWLDFTSATTLACYVSSTATKPGSPTLLISTGVASANAAQIYFGSQTTDITFDKLRVASSAIGSNPT